MSSLKLLGLLLLRILILGILFLTLLVSVVGAVLGALTTFVMACIITLNVLGIDTLPEVYVHLIQSSAVTLVSIVLAAILVLTIEKLGVTNEDRPTG